MGMEEAMNEHLYIIRMKEDHRRHEHVAGARDTLNDAMLVRGMLYFAVERGNGLLVTHGTSEINKLRWSLEDIIGGYERKGSYTQYVKNLVIDMDICDSVKFDADDMFEKMLTGDKEYMDLNDSVVDDCECICCETYRNSVGA